MVFVTCEKCYLPDISKVYAKFFGFETRNELAMFEKFHKEFCVCEHDIICCSCTVAKIYNKEQYKVFEHCLNLDYLCEIKGKLHGSMFSLFEKKSHFICRIIGEHFYFEHKCFFTGNRVLISLKTAYEEWENFKKKEIINNTPTVLVFKNVDQLQKNS